MGETPVDGVLPKKRKTRWGEAPSSSTPQSATQAVPLHKGPVPRKIDFEARAAAAKAALERARASTGAFASGPPPALGVLNRSVQNALPSQMNLTMAAQQQLMMAQKVNEGRQQSVNNILESLKGRLPIALRTAAAAAAGQRIAAGAMVLAGTKPAMSQRFDAVGRLVDDEGNVVPMGRPVHATLKINQAMQSETRKGKESAFGTTLKRRRSVTSTQQNPFYDPTVPSNLAGVGHIKKGGLRFVEGGFYMRRQEVIEKRQRLTDDAGLAALNLGTEDTVAQTQEESAKAHARLIAETFVRGTRTRGQKHATDNLVSWARGSGGAESGDADQLERRQQAYVPMQRKREDNFPLLESWDLLLLAGTAQPSREEWIDPPQNLNFPYALKSELITTLVEHPVPVDGVVDSQRVFPQSFLTERERKKKRRKERRARELEKQDKIRMGLIAPDPPKVKLANMMRVLGEEAAANPTRIEEQVKRSVQERLEGHEKRNADKKLTGERKAEKQKNKWLQKSETAQQVTQLVFSLKDIHDKRHLFKIHQNAKELMMTGAALLCPGVGNMVVVEGGPRAAKRYKALMSRRIKWTEPEDPQFCELIWEGVSAERSFKNWQMTPCKSEDEIMGILQPLKAEKFWATIKRARDKQQDIL